MNEEIREYYQELLNIYQGDQTLERKYRKMRELLERAVRSQIKDTSLQTTDFAARLNYVATMSNMDNVEFNNIHSFRLTSNEILNHRLEPTNEDFLRHLSAVSFALRRIFKVDIPLNLFSVLPKYSSTSEYRRVASKKIKRVRVCFDYADETYLYVRSSDSIDDDYIKVRYNIKGVNEEFAESIDNLWRFAQLNLLDVEVNDEGEYTPSFIVVEPDYLIDISSLAECYRDYGSHPGNYILSRLMPIDNTRPLLLGNIANLFLDEWIHSKDGEPDYLECMKMAFRQYPIELAACDDLKDPIKEKEFFNSCRLHFDNIRKTVEETFVDPGYRLDKQDAVLEPSYICEALGIQGRLDYMQRDMSSFIEMKSGKADEYAIPGKIEPKENNRVQMLLYMAVLDYSMGRSRRSVHPYLFYSRYPMLYPARASWTQLRHIINLRNLILQQDYGTQLHNNIDYTAELLSGINSTTLNTKKLSNHFWERYLRPSIDSLDIDIKALDDIEKRYLYQLYNFITKELYTSKSGDAEYESARKGASALWRTSLDEKCEAGEILYDLIISDNHVAELHKAHITLEIPDYGEEYLPNFRNGDAVVLYERNTNDDNVSNKMVFKGNIENINDEKITIRLRASQKNVRVFPQESKYAVEHDVMDTTFRFMYTGLSQFIKANPMRRKLLLGIREPEHDDSYDEKIAISSNDFERVALKVEAAKDCFLLVGPPGTGKTSCALKTIVERAFNSGKQLLIMAYTNRAVDEICQSVESITPKIRYIRVGSELSCDARYRGSLIENVLDNCQKRADVQRLISECRVYIGTVASISAKPELFRLKRFDLALIDEATQVLEPQLLGILSAKFSDGRDAIGKFVLIGDYKQLPAVVLQSDDDAIVCDNTLRELGFESLKKSFFERLYTKYKNSDCSYCIDMLCRQGRMHPMVEAFPNEEFYEGKLIPVGLPHQLENINNAMNFIPSQRDIDSISGKSNKYEAKIVADIVQKLFFELGDRFVPSLSIGVITPYRSQIAMIRKEIHDLDIPQLDEISVDTVERYQGSQRDIIIYSFSVNYLYQLKMLPNIIEENGNLIDRKLNVVLTRSRRRIYITGVEDILRNNVIYRNLIDYIKGTTL